MDTLFKAFLFLHIAGGTTGLIAGTIVTLTKKGNKQHQLTGKIFAISMLGAGIASLILAAMRPNPFLFAVGILTVYMAATGWRYLKLKQLGKGQKPAITDWLLQVFMLLGCIWFIKLGIVNIMHRNYFGGIILLFAWRGASFVWQDYNTYKGKITITNYWLIFHLQRMMGAYIASLTAFAVVNAPQNIGIIVWILPAAVLVPLIIKWTKKYSLKTKPY